MAGEPIRTASFHLGALCVAAMAVAAAASYPYGPSPVSIAAVWTSPLPALPRAASDDAIRLVPAPSGNEARYRVREQLARFDFPNDAVGVTTAIRGALVLNPDGSVVLGASRFEIDLTALQSDNTRRDNYVRRNTLETERYPLAIFEPSAIEGLAVPLPRSGEFELSVHGNLTVHGVTRPTTWAVTAVATGDAFTGSAVTELTFSDFDMSIPRVASVLSVRDLIRLEYDFHLVREEGEGALSD
jgi:polyisoprenoid-binding protein YceI